MNRALGLGLGLALAAFAAGCKPAAPAATSDSQPNQTPSQPLAAAATSQALVAPAEAPKR